MDPEQFPDGSFGEQLRSYRRRAGWSIEQLADAAGVGSSTVSNAEHGLHQTRGDIARQLADALKLGEEERTRFLAARVKPIPAQAPTTPPTPTPALSPSPSPTLPSPSVRAERGDRFGRGTAWFVALPLVVLMLASAAGWWWMARSQEQQQIEQLILDATAEELGWYQHPTEPRRERLTRYFLPAEMGGRRLPRIEHTVNRLNQERRWFAPDASRSLVVQKITVHLSGMTATAETREVWYQPLIQVVDGVERRPLREELRPHPMHTDDDQQYLLRKVDGRWMIEDNPVV